MGGPDGHLFEVLKSAFMIYAMYRMAPHMEGELVHRPPALHITQYIIRTVCI